MLRKMVFFKISLSSCILLIYRKKIDVFVDFLFCDRANLTSSNSFFIIPWFFYADNHGLWE